MADLLESDPNAVASYPFQDIEDNLGYVTYYGFSAEDSSGITYHLDKETVFSSMTTILSTVTALHWDIDFDTGTFNTPRTLEGTIIIDCMVANHLSGGSPEMRIFFKVYKYDGSTETQLGSTWTGKWVTASTGASERYPQVARISIPRTVFKRGDLLRINLTTDGQGSGSRVFEIGIDPENRDGSYIKPSTNAGDFTVFKVRVPYKLNL